MRHIRFCPVVATLLACAGAAFAPAQDNPAAAHRMSRAAVQPTTPAVIQGSNALVMSTQWERMPGCAKRISIAALTQIWVIGCSPDLDTRIFHWQYDTWQMDARSAHSIAAVSALPLKRDTSIAGVAGAATVSKDGLVAFEGHPLPVRFMEVATGGGWIWAILQPVGDHTGGLVVRSDGLPKSEDCAGGIGVGEMGLCTDYYWSAPFGGLYAKRLGVGLTDATAWAIGEDGRIYKQVMQGEGWDERPGCAVAIANAGQDNVWVIGCEEPDSEGNRGIHRWTGESWADVPGRGVEIALQSDGTAWLLTADGGIWRHKN